MQRVAEVFHRGWLRIGNLTDIVDIQAKGSLSLGAALARDGTVHYWKYVYELGWGGMPDIPEYLQPPLRRLKGRYTALGSSAGNYLYALDEAGNVTVWGWTGKPITFTPSGKVRKIAGGTTPWAKVYAQITYFFLLYDDGRLDACAIENGKVSCGRPLPPFPRPVVDIDVYWQLAAQLDDNSVIVVDFKGGRPAQRWQGRDIRRLCNNGDIWVQDGPTEIVNLHNFPDIGSWPPSHITTGEWITEVIDMSCHLNAVVLGKNGILAWANAASARVNPINLTTD